MYNIVRHYVKRQSIFSLHSPSLLYSLPLLRRSSSSNAFPPKPARPGGRSPRSPRPPRSDIPARSDGSTRPYPRTADRPPVVTNRPGGKPERWERPASEAWTSRPGGPDGPSLPKRSPRVKWTSKPGMGRSGRISKPGMGKPGRSNRSERPDRPERPERPSLVKARTPKTGWRTEEDQEPRAFAPRQFGSGKTVLSPDLVKDIKTALHFHRDPFTMASYVDSVLKQDRYKEAEEVVKAATSKGMDCIVSWNYLIDYSMKNNKPSTALKAFNDFRKRGLSPNAQTFTTLFSGCSKLENPKSFLLEAIRLYHNMGDDNKDGRRINRNIVHLNALISACARARDMDTLYTLLGDVEEKGNLAPTAYTYAITFHAMREIYDKPTYGATTLQTEGFDKERIININRASRIWEDAMRRWRQGRLLVDEELICSYGRFLLAGHSEHVDQIFDIVSETMDVPYPPGKGRGKGNQGQGEGEAEEGEKGELGDSTKYAVRRPPRKQLANPGPNTLSMLMNACQARRSTTWAPHYWNLLTSKPYNVTPDAENFRQYLTTTRKGKASAQTVHLILSMPPKLGVSKPALFRIGMSACVRDNLNLKSFEHAGKILDAMMHVVATPDIHTLRNYLRVGMFAGKRHYLDEGISGRSDYATQLIRALERLESPLQMAWDHAFRGTPMHYTSESAPSDATRTHLRQVRDSEIQDRLHERKVGYRTLTLEALDVEDKMLDAEEESLVGGGYQGKGKGFVKGNHPKDQGKDKALSKTMRQYNEQREVVALGRRMLAMYDRVTDIGGGHMDAREMQTFKKKRNKLNGRVMRFFEDRSLMEPNLPREVAAAALERERLRIDSARTNFQPS